MSEKMGLGMGRRVKGWVTGWGMRMGFSDDRVRMRMGIGG